MNIARIKKTITPIHIGKPKEFQIGWSKECFVYGLNQLTICNFSGSCRNCPKYKESKQAKEVKHSK